jgi:hypothetical protein
MINENIPEYKIDPLFSRLIQPYSENEIEKIRGEISLTVPTVHIWQGTHLSDQHLYNLCVENRIPYHLSEMFFDDQTKAAIYVCSSQLSRENLTPEYRKYIIGQKFGYSVLCADDTKQADSRYTVATSLGHELYISAGTVMKYYSFANALNDIFDQSTDLARRILLGKVKISHENILELSHLMPEEIKAIAKSVIDDNITHISLSYIRNEVKWTHIQTRSGENQRRREKREQKISKHAVIRQMPQYDPDAEVNSLCMTIDSWISSIRRVHNSSNFIKITNKASLQLIKKLSLLEHTVNTIQESLVERNNDDRI